MPPYVSTTPKTTDALTDQAIEKRPLTHTAHRAKSSSPAVDWLCAASIIFGVAVLVELFDVELPLGDAYRSLIELNFIDLSAACEELQPDGLLLQPWAAISSLVPSIGLAFVAMRYMFVFRSDDPALSVMTALNFWQNLCGFGLHSSWVDSYLMTMSLSVGGCLLALVSLYDTFRFLKAISPIKRPSQRNEVLMHVGTIVTALSSTAFMMSDMTKCVGLWGAQLACILGAFICHLLLSSEGLHRRLGQTYAMLLITQAFFPIAILVIDQVACKWLDARGLLQYLPFPLHVVTHAEAGMFAWAMATHIRIVAPFGSRREAIERSKKA